MIEFALDNLDKNIRSKIKNTVSIQCEILNNNGFSNNTLNAYLSTEKQRSYQDKFFSLSLSCPFLDNNNTCLIYNIRPTVCWSYKSYGNPSDCAYSWDIPNTIHYNDWEQQLLNRLYQAKKPSRHKKLIILQYAILSCLN